MTGPVCSGTGGPLCTGIGGRMAPEYAHSVWDCKYHIVWIPKCRKKVLYGRIRQQLGEAIRELARQRESLILEGHLCSDHVHVYIAIPPKFAVAQVVGYCSMI